MKSSPSPRALEGELPITPPWRVCIVGVGLLGGSLGLALRKHRLARQVVGLCRREASALDAVTFGAVDTATLDPAALGSADLIVVATPLSMFEEAFRLIGQHAAQPCLVTDVGSAKGEVYKLADRRLPPSAMFVGSHPMAGSEKTGVQHASADLFTHETCIVCQRERIDDAQAVKAISAMWTQLGMHVTHMTARAHDRYVAQISHLPHVAASLLVNLASDEALAISGPGFRDMTRIASGDPDLWVDILRSNQAEAKKALISLSHAANELWAMIEEGNWQVVKNRLTRAKQRRDQMLANADRQSE